MQGPEKTHKIGAPADAPPIRPPPKIEPGAMIGDKYRIECELGRGGFGVVVRAVHVTLDQRVAIKVLTDSEGATDAEWAEDAARFRREAKATAALRSQHVVRVLDVDVLESGYPYIVMEYLQGKTLHDLIQTSPPLSIDEVVDYGLQVLAALADAHAVGIVHRDLKPANVFLTTGVGNSTIAKVLDFGVSKMLSSDSHRITRTGAIVGTLAYMAPEQMLDARRVDGRADLWSLGLVLYEALGRSHPFGAAAVELKVIMSILKSSIPSVRTVRPDVPPELEAIVSRLLEKNPERRFSSAIEVAAALAPLASARSRPVVEEIRRAAPPSGAAAPRADLARTDGLADPESPSEGGGTSPVFGVIVALVTATIVVVAFVSYVKPRLNAQRSPPPQVSAEAFDSRPEVPSTSTSIASPLPLDLPNVTDLSLPDAATTP
ncbi:MAG TPA: serine/threonine-protein kinase [Labilithrix sp.]|nr:serine/threonine-protein kinase [Labilithrix sp.]